MDEYTFVIYRHGGLAASTIILLFEVRRERLETVWEFLGTPMGERIDVLLRQLNDGDPCFVTPPERYYDGETRDRCRVARTERLRKSN